MHLYGHDERPPRTMLEDGVRMLTAAAALDVVLVEGFRDVPCPLRLWVGPGSPAPGDGLCLHVAAADHADPARVRDVADRILDAGC